MAKKEEKLLIIMLTIDKHATGIISLASKTSITMSKVTEAPILSGATSMLGGEVEVIFSCISSFGYFLYS